MGDLDRVVVFERISDPPRVYLARGFLSEDECDSMRRLASAFGYNPTGWGEEATFDAAEGQRLVAEGCLAAEDLAVLERLTQRRAALSGAPEECFAPISVRNTVPPTRGSRQGESHVWFPMHLDVLEADAYMTIIVYLETVPPAGGGHTLFPLAVAPGAPPLSGELLQASEGLIRRGLYGLKHYSDAILNDEAEQLAVAAVQAAEVSAAEASGLFWGPGGRGVAVGAQRGDAVCLFTRRADGHIDPAAWHAVAAMGAPASDGPAAAGRRISQLFHRVPRQVKRDRYGRSPPQPVAVSVREASLFCRDHARLRPCSAAGVRFDVVEDVRVGPEGRP